MQLLQVEKSFNTSKIQTSLLLNKRDIWSTTPTRWWHMPHTFYFWGETLFKLNYSCPFGYLTFPISYPLQRYTALNITPNLLQTMTKNQDKYSTSFDNERKTHSKANKHWRCWILQILIKWWQSTALQIFCMNE